MIKPTRINLNLSYCGVYVEENILKNFMGKEYNKYIKSLTIKLESFNSYTKIINLTGKTNRNGTNYIILPRTELMNLYSKTIVQYTRSTYEPKKYKLGIELFNNQIIVLDKLLSIFTIEKINSGMACAYLSMQAGYGKTFIAGALIAHFGLRTLYVTVRCCLEDQVVKDLSMCLSSMSINSYKRDSGADVVVIVIDSALNLKMEYISNFDIVILDEVHSYCSEIRKKIFKIASAPIMLGLTATSHHRSDKLDDIAIRELAFDGIIYADKLRGFDNTGSKYTIDVKSIKYFGSYEYTKILKHTSTDMMFMHYMNNQFISDPKRNEILVMELALLYKENYNTYVFAEEIDILRTFKSLFFIHLPEAEPHTYELISENAKENMEGAKEHARVIFTTYAYSSVGLSIERMTAILFITSRMSGMEQIVGRILRANPSIHRKIVDIIDYGTPIKKHYRYRKKTYEYYNANISMIIV